jgi:putative tricarboxylic transport membrane protein
MKRSDAAVSVILIGLAGFILLESRQLSFGSMRVPQTAFFPKILAVLLLIFSGISLLQAIIGTNPSTRSEPLTAEGWARIGATLATMVGFAFLLERAGFFLTTFFLMVLLLRAIEAQRWSKVIGIAVATALISYAIFGWLLGIPLPTGILGI